MLIWTMIFCQLEIYTDKGNVYSRRKTFKLTSQLISELTSESGSEILTSNKAHIVHTTSTKGNATLCKMENSFAFSPGKIISLRAHRQSSDSNISNDSLHSVSTWFLFVTGWNTNSMLSNLLSSSYRFKDSPVSVNWLIYENNTFKSSYVFLAY